MTTEEARAANAKRKVHNGGRKRKEEEDVIKAALDKAMPLDDVMAMFALAVKSRDPWAIPLWLGYHFGKPVERQEITGAGGGALEVVLDIGKGQVDPDGLSPWTTSDIAEQGAV